MTGWLKLHRELIDKPIWLNSTLEQRVILITLLCMVNHKPNQWEFKGELYEVKAGQVITSVKSIVAKCKDKSITTQKVRNALVRFENFGFLTTETTNKNTLVSIVNWDSYQSSDTDNNNQNNNRTTIEQQSNNNRTTTKKECKERDNVNNDKNIQSVSQSNIYNNTPTPPTLTLIDKTDRQDGIDFIDFENKVKKNIDYDVAEYNSDDKAVIDNLIALMIDLLATNDTLVAIGNRRYPKQYVYSKLLTLDDSGIRFLIQKQRNISVEKDVKNPVRYMQGIIFNTALNFETERQKSFNDSYYKGKGYYC